ncbi:hypothetical protein OnM2_052065 [Erysiphe neolycopersici]|uniref:Uncharacterized protein n=1 Tax=Erysiphe neolycopersici TaxID=212602 RepID=A0A420HSA3_9PEZI|nr:hypothetical protein OnM2_052065 [Erysiphe neolycopersici]
MKARHTECLLGWENKTNSLQKSMTYYGASTRLRNPPFDIRLPNTTTGEYGEISDESEALYETNRGS